MEWKLFTIEEANALLPQLREDIVTLQSMVDHIEFHEDELQRLKTSELHFSVGVQNESDPYFERESQLDFMRMELQLQVDNFSRKGVLLKMISPGLLDFPAIIEGEEVLLCWKEGEDQITHYHGWHDGFMGRRKV